SQIIALLFFTAGGGGGGGGDSDDGGEKLIKLVAHAIIQQTSVARLLSIAFIHFTVTEDTNDKASTCGKLLICLSVVLVILTLPFSLFVCFKVVQEYERAVIFRLGRLMQGGAKGPGTLTLFAQAAGIFFILPCIDSYARVQLDEATDAWGIKVERVEIKDVRLPVQLQRAMAAEAEAAREARAKVIAAEGEQKASRALREASEVIGDSPAALQLRYLQTLSAISAEKNSTIVFPLPIDLITYFLKSNDADTIKTAADTAQAIADREASPAHVASTVTPVTTTAAM
uniref:Band 7 domain-containing protein n=1 Tax=Glossina morsitans morsitans TaxID=37546 RepID=A0A1B0G0A0_GLOMM